MADLEQAEKEAAYQAALEWVERGYYDPRISFEAGAAWQRERHSPLCECGETVPRPCIAKYPDGHNATKCGATLSQERDRG